jgi:hypothetical protein
VCGRAAAKIQLSTTPEGVRFVYSGPGGSNGSGDLIKQERAEALRSAMSPSFNLKKFAAASLYDGAGFCGKCSAFYCSTHWNVSGSGGGVSPKGHVKSLDLHWQPDV